MTLRASRIVVIALLAGLAGCSEGSDPAENPAAGDGAIMRDTAADIIDPAPAREVLKRYFALQYAGDARAAESLWCDPQMAARFRGNIEGFGPVKVNIADPLAGGLGSEINEVSISLQLLSPDNSNLRDGSASLAPSPQRGGALWCIRQIALQFPPQA
ncbi:hypothetical protein [Qipengyuania sphaerica]|uniref:hypothetical protein n=1 Tax=Qipengyuania sphaerica TaxID=2867243 RepID=UPI001C88B94D|nr:hypothetical protein [Qipengyuania sphaerica]MBX7541117.1 hypothetical protein [Qipengyuania sphaerica]